MFSQETLVTRTEDEELVPEDGWEAEELEEEVDELGGGRILKIFV